VRKIAGIALLASVLLSSGVTRGSIIAWNYSNPNPSSSDASVTQMSKNNSVYDMSVGNAEYDGTGQLNLSLTTNTTTDPSILINDSFNNDTNFAWTAYDVNVLMPNMFTLTNVQSLTPNSWSPTIGPEFYNAGLSEYEYQITFTGANPIQVGQNFNYQYQVNFSGLTSYQFSEQLTPVPEPASLGVVLVLAIACGASRRLFRSVA